MKKKNCFYRSTEYMQSINIYRDFLDELLNEYHLSTTGDSLLYFYLKLYSMCSLGKKRTKTDKFPYVYGGECVKNTKELLAELGLRTMGQVIKILDKLSESGLVHYAMAHLHGGPSNARFFKITVVDAKKQAEELEKKLGGKKKIYGCPKHGYFIANRDILRKLMPDGVRLSEMDSFLYLWIHTVYNDEWALCSDRIPVSLPDETGGIPLCSSAILGRAFHCSGSNANKLVHKFENLGLVRTYRFGNTAFIISPTAFMKWMFGTEDIRCDIMDLYNDLSVNGFFPYADTAAFTVLEKKTDDQIEQETEAVIRTKIQENAKCTMIEEILKESEMKENTAEETVEEKKDETAGDSVDMTAKMPEESSADDICDSSYNLLPKSANGTCEEYFRRRKPDETAIQRTLDEIGSPESVEDVKRCRIPSKYMPGIYDWDSLESDPMGFLEEPYILKQERKKMIERLKYIVPIKRVEAARRVEKNVNRKLSTLGVHYTMKEANGMIKSYIFLDKKELDLPRTDTENNPKILINIFDRIVQEELNENFENFWKPY